MLHPVLITVTVAQGFPVGKIRHILAYMELDYFLNSKRIILFFMLLFFLQIII